eukprot:282485_1
MDINIMLALVLISVTALLFATKLFKRQYPSESTISSILQTGDMVIMINEKHKPTHATIGYKTDSFSANGNDNIGVLITGIKASNAAQHLYKPKRGRKWVANVYRYSPSGISDDKVKKIRRLIGKQAFKWFSIGEKKNHQTDYKEEKVEEKSKEEKIKYNYAT